MVRRHWISWLGLSCLVVGGWYLGAPSASRRARADEPNKAQKYALLVGVREYKTPALRSLKYSERDIEDLAKVLLDAGFPEANLRILTQERAVRGLRHLPTSDNIRTELDRMLKLVELADDPAATVIIALAGHGIIDFIRNKDFATVSVAACGSEHEDCVIHKPLPWPNPRLRLWCSVRHLSQCGSVSRRRGHARH